MNEPHASPGADELLPRRRTGTPAPDGSAADVYLRRESAGTWGILLIVGGCVLLGIALIGFVFCLVVRVNQFTLQFATTLPTLLGLGAIMRGWASLRSPSEVIVDQGGITLAGGSGERTLAWSEIGLASATEAPLAQKRRLTLFDRGGKRLATISSDFSDFEQLVEQVRGYVNAGPEGAADALQLSKARRTALFTGVVGAFLGFAGGFAAYDTCNAARGEELLASDGIEGEAAVLRRFLAPNGVTCRLEYEVEGVGGQKGKRNAEVEPEYWNELEGATSVPVRYVPAEPEISRLLTGEAPSDKPGLVGGYGLGVAGGCMSLFMIAVSIMQFYGWDYGTDPKTGKLGFRRIGT